MTPTEEYIERIKAACNNECEFELAESCSPAAMTAVLAFIDAQAAEIERLRTDAGRYRWFCNYLIGSYTTHDDAIIAAKTVHQVDAVVDAAMKETPCKN